MKRFVLFLLFIFSIIIFNSCKTGSKFEPNNAEEALDEGIRLFNKEEWTEALSYLDMIKLQFPGNKVADKAQYYTAEINFARKEYILAAFNYNRVHTAYPGSEYSKIALYKSGLSQFLMIPDYHKDQEYTKKAIKTLQDYQFFYPDKDSLYDETNKMIKECRNLLGEKEYQIADLYRTLESPQSALIYYESVIKNYDDTEYLERAWFGKIEMLYWMKKIEDAESATKNYNTLFPDGSYKAKISELKQTFVRL